MTPETTTLVTAEDYLAEERLAESKSEWGDGEIREMTGASRMHVLIAGNVFGWLWAALKTKPFEVYNSDMRVRVPDGHYYYPDVSVAAVPAQFEEDQRPDTLTNPLLVVEVLSDSTESVDRGEKLDNYRRIPSLTNYLLVSQHTPRVDHYGRQADGSWRLEIVADRAGVVRLPSLDCELPLAEVYDRLPA